MRLSGFVRRRWPLILFTSIFIWTILIICNYKSVDHDIPPVKSRISFNNSYPFYMKKPNGAESDFDLDGDKLQGKADAKEINEDRALERADPFDADAPEDPEDARKFKVNPKMKKLVNEERWGVDRIPEVNLTAIAEIHGTEEEVSSK